MPTYVETIAADCCCDSVPVDCPDCPSIPTTYTFTISATGDLAFLDGDTVTVVYIGYSGGYFSFLGSALIDGCTVQVGWGMEDTSTCSVVAGDISVDCPACTDGPQSFDGGAVASAWSFSCSPPTFNCFNSELLNFHLDRCYFGTIGGTAVEA